MSAVGFDLSYSRSGFCQIGHNPATGEIEVSTEKFKTIPHTPLIPRTKEIKDWVFEKISCTPFSGAHYVFPEIIVVESAVFGGKRASMLGSLSMGVLLNIYEQFVLRGMCDLLLVPPPTLKRFAGVKGKAKSLMVAAFKELNPDHKRICNDEADAYFLARLGAAYKTAEHGGTIPQIAQDVLFSEQLTKAGIPKGLALRPGECFIRGID